MQHESILQAINIAGSLKGLAELLGVSGPTVHEWKTGERKVPFERCIQIEKVTLGAVTCEMLRPDVLWGVLRQAPATCGTNQAHPATETIANQET